MIPEEAFFCKECEMRKEQEKDKMEKETKERLMQTKK